MQCFVFSFLTLLIVLSGCCPQCDHPEERQMIFVNNEELSAILWDYLTELKYDKHLHIEHTYVCGSETGAKVRLEFITQNIMELCEARHLIVDVVEGLLDRINNDPIYALYPAPYPLTPDKLEIYIEFE